MRFQKAMKRIVALGTGALMLSSAYAAADLANYPSPFVKDGKFSGVLVVGDKAAAEDVIGITDIISSLQAASVKAAPGSGGSVNLETSGDVFTYEINLGKEGEHVMLYHNKSILFVKPTINHYDGHEYWEVASWKREELENFIKELKGHMDVCKIIKLENSKLTDVYFPNTMPKLSKHQKIALELAYLNGYYSYPRKIHLNELAKIAKIGISTFQEHLRKAELKLLPAIIEYQIKPKDK